jgi:hypothetical protein
VAYLSRRLHAAVKSRLLVHGGGLSCSDSAAITKRDEDYMNMIGYSMYSAVDRGGIEPPTHGFSVHCSTN